MFFLSIICNCHCNSDLKLLKHFQEHMDDLRNTEAYGLFGETLRDTQEVSAQLFSVMPDSEDLIVIASWPPSVLLVSPSIPRLIVKQPPSTVPFEDD